MLEIKPVRTASDLERFVKLPYDIYCDSPHWVAPLLTDVRKALTPGKNPFWSHAERELFLVERDGKPVGRIAAIVDRNYNEFHKSSIGFFGFFESVDDPEVAATLLDAAENWCREHNMASIYGPANPAMNDEVGLLIDGFDSPPMIKTSYNPPYYVGLIENRGYSKVKDLYAFITDLARELPAKLQRVMTKLKRKPGLEVRLIDPRNLKQDLLHVKEIYNDAWSHNWDFSPMTDEEIDDLAAQLGPFLKPDLMPIVFYKGEPAGMAVALPDYNQALRGVRGRLFPVGWLKFLLARGRISQFRLWALGMKRKFHSLGYDSLLYYECYKGAKRLGYTRGETSWVLEDNDPAIRPLRLFGSEVYKTYRVYSRQLTPQPTG